MLESIFKEKKMEINNETLGQAAEKVICDLNGLDSSEFAHRSNENLERRITPIIKEALKELPRITQHVGLERGARGGQSKSTIDFYCGEKTLSIKTTKNKSFKLCPSECGQPGANTFDLYFGHLYEGEIDHQKCKTLVINKIDEMIPIYLNHLFDCDYMLLVYVDSPGDGFHIYKKESIPVLEWNISKFSFTRGLEDWNESTTIKYDNISIAEFQLHQHRNSYKFRFHILNLLKVIDNLIEE
jgi:hypothetical protein